MNGKSVRTVFLPSWVLLSAFGLCRASAQEASGHVAATTVCAHAETRLNDDQLVPVVELGSERTTIGLCLETDSDTDLVPWRVRLTLSRAERQYVFEETASDRSLGPVLRFEATVPAEVPPGEYDLCGSLRLSVHESERIPLGCHPVIVSARSDYGRLEARLEAIVANRNGSTAAQRIGALEDVIEEAQNASFLFLELRARLIALHFRRRGGADLADLEERLSKLPAWLAQPAALSLRSSVLYQQAVTAADVRGDWQGASELAEESVGAARRVVDPRWIHSVAHQAEMLSRAGNGHDAVELLRGALGQCSAAKCREQNQRAAETSFAWFVALHGDATAKTLYEAWVMQERAARIEALDPATRANRRINVALIRLLMGKSPRAALEVALRLLGPPEEYETRDKELSEWVELIDARWNLDDGASSKALVSCSKLARSATTERLRAWAWNCTGRAARALGRLDDAADAFGRAIAHHQYLTPLRIGKNSNIGRGPRMEAFYLAAVTEIERGELEAAFDLLQRLDGLAVMENEISACIGRLTEEESEAWLELQGRIEEDLRSLDQLDFAASAWRMKRLQRQREEIEVRLWTHFRALPGCAFDLGPNRRPALPIEGAQHLAFAVAGEIVLLSRDRSGGFTVRRTPFAREELSARLAAIADALDERTLGDREWVELTRPFAEALIPERIGSGDILVFSLYGELQHLPLSALPLPETSADEIRWLSELAEVRVRPAGVGLGSESRKSSGSARAGGVEPRASANCLFVVDPHDDLGISDRDIQTYRELGPGVRVLAEERATKTAVSEALGSAECLHIDSHGVDNAGFPDLSYVQLAERDVLRMRDLAEMELELGFANVATCHSARWNPTVDAGRFGFAGLFVRLGAEWAIGTSSQIDRDVARRFNNTFYRARAEGHDVPRAYQLALRDLQRTARAVDWAPFVLLDGTRSR